MGAFAFKLERLDGTPADPPSFKTTRARLEPRRHDSAGLEQDASGGSRSRRGRGPTAGTGRCGRGLKSV
jgi:hypothetical protein